MVTSNRETFRIWHILPIKGTKDSNCIQLKKKKSKVFFRSLKILYLLKFGSALFLHNKKQLQYLF